MILLICGSREWAEYLPILDALEQLISLGIRPTIIHGNCRGADKLAATAGKSLGLPVFACDAQWEFYGRSAGPVRNKWMADMEPDLVWAFHADMSHSTGTKNMIKHAQAQNIPFKIWTGK